MEIMHTSSRNHEKVKIMTNACTNVLCEVIAGAGGCGGAAPPQRQKVEHGLCSATLDLAMCLTFFLAVLVTFFLALSLSQAPSVKKR